MADSTKSMQKRIRPAWVENLITFYQGRIARQFVLHFNITDYVIDLSKRFERGKGEYVRTGEVVEVLGDDGVPMLQTMREYLYQFLFQSFSCQSIYTYSLANGLTVEDAPQFESGRGQDPMDGVGMLRLYETYRTMHSTSNQPSRRTSDNIELPTEISENFKLLNLLLRQKYTDPVDANRESPIALVLDYAEKLIPFHLDEGHGDREQLQALEVVQRWALDPLIRQTNNLIILMTTNIGQVPTSVYAEGSGCRAIRVPLPDENERSAFIRFKMSRAWPRIVPLDTTDFGLIEAEQAHRLARATQGMRLTDIDNMSRRIAAEYRKRKNDAGNGNILTPLLRAEDVQKVKAEVIQAQSADLLEIVPPARGFNEIGGLDNLKQYLRRRTKFMRSSQYSPLVPSGLLLAGPPGTGKTIIAEALATESGFNLVKMRSIQDKWVGSSERNLELVLNLLKDLHPVVVFIDEIDQAMVRRDTGQSGDSGVGARMFARLLEEMSNAENRGRILWVAATNRADILDEALLRRFDRVVPLLVPDVHESCRIFATMIDAVVKQSGGRIKVAYSDDLMRSVVSGSQERSSHLEVDPEKFAPVAQLTSDLGLTGASIEIVVRRAIEMAYEELMDKQVDQGLEYVPFVELHHLMKAVKDFKLNYQREVYDYQSLLAIRACNFHSVIPILPKSGVYQRIQKTDGTIDVELLEQEIRSIEQNRLARR